MSFFSETRIMSISKCFDKLQPKKKNYQKSTSENQVEKLLIEYAFSGSRSRDNR